MKYLILCLLSLSSCQILTRPDVLKAQQNLVIEILEEIMEEVAEKENAPEAQGAV